MSSFIDKIKVMVQAGTGGNGCLSFRREKFIPYGGPNGGNGGKGGDVYFVAERNMTTLLDLTYRPHFKAADGSPGESWDKAGRGGEDLYIMVPCGTVVLLDGQTIVDMREDKQVFLVARGGRGGRGNSSFKTKVNTAPRIAEKGEPGEAFDFTLELKLIADVGLAGCPNAGKSTLLSRLSAAKPKIADYPFTTLSPNLGVAQYKSFSFVVADIPGLIEGAHAGKGLGTEFLRHVERTRVLVHLIDPFGFGGKTPLQCYRAITRELALYSKKLSKTPTLIAVNKMDCTGAEAALKKLRKSLKGKRVFAISAVTGDGLDALMRQVVEELKAARAKGEEVAEPVSDVRKFIFEDAFTVEKEDNSFRVRGKRVERLAAMTNFEQPEAVERFQNILKKMGVDKMLARKGAQLGDPVAIGNQEFTYQPSETSSS